MRDLNPTTFNAISFSFLAIILTSIIIATGLFPTGVLPFVLAVMSGAFGLFAALQIYFYALKRASAHRIVPIANSASVWAVILALLLLGEGITAILPFSLALVVCGAFLLAPQNEESNNWRFAVPLAITVAVLWGFNMTIQKAAINSGMSFLNLIWISVVSAAILFNLTAVITRSWRGQCLNRKSVGLSIASGLSNNLFGLLFYTLALGMEKVSAIAPFTSATIPFGFLLSVFIVREKPTKKAIIGMLLVFLGVFIAAI